MKIGSRVRVGPDVGVVCNVYSRGGVQRLTVRFSCGRIVHPKSANVIPYRRRQLERVR